MRVYAHAYDRACVLRVYYVFLQLRMRHISAHSILQDVFKLFIWLIIIKHVINSSATPVDDSQYSFINSRNGSDVPSCLRNSTNSCQSLKYALGLIHSFNATSHHDEFILQDDQFIHDTIVVVGIIGLVLRGSNAHITIYCATPNSIVPAGAGLSFVSVSNLHIVNLTLEGCGSLQNSTTLRGNETTMFRSESALLILNCTNVTIDTCTLRHSRGKALTLYDNSGQIYIKNSHFTDNSAPKIENAHFFGGGAILIEYTYCSPGYHNCDSRNSANNSIVIENCMFDGNRAIGNSATYTLSSHAFQFPIRSDSDSNYKDQGGAITMIFKRFSSNNSITIFNCTFYNNTARFGGALEQFFENSASGNRITVNHSRFVGNRALYRGGGAMELVFTLGSGTTNNTLAVYNTEFINNEGWWGGAVAIWSTPASRLGNAALFSNCTWFGNSALVGGALSVLNNGIALHGGSIYPNITLDNCLFMSNFLNGGNRFHRNIDSGILHVEDFTVTFSGYMQFNNNTGSAILASSAIIYINANSTVFFKENTATQGGAINLIGFTTLKLWENTKVLFEANHAERGGALSYMSNHQTDYIFSHKCFISYKNEISPDMWDTLLIFINNTATYGSAIYVDTLLPCTKQVGDITHNNITETLRWKSFQYFPQSKTNTIATEPSSIAFQLPSELAPGEVVHINPMSYDELNQTTMAMYEAKIQSYTGTDHHIEVKTHISDGHLHVTNGTPGSSFTFTLETVGRHWVSSQQTCTLSKCPVGFVLKDGSCFCDSRSSPQFPGVSKCDAHSFSSYLEEGYWAGCIGDEMIVTAECPIGFCNFPSHHITELTPLLRTCPHITEQSVCVGNRRGQLCGECKDGYSVFYHSENFKCDKCSIGAWGLLIYFVSEIMPLCLFFTLLIFFQFNMTSSSGQSFTFFVQIALLLSYRPLPHEKGTTLPHILKNVFHLLFGPFNLDFFKTDLTSFCLWNGTTALDILAFKYVTVVLGVMLVLSLISFFRFRCTERIAKTLLCCPRVRQNNKNERTSNSRHILNVIATFLIIFYDRITITSFYILARADLYGEGDVRVKSVVAVSGDLDYFGKTHVIYAFPALFVILLLTLPPPLILIVYPLLCKFKARFNFNKPNDKKNTSFFICKPLLPLIRFFQEDYRDGCQFFSGFQFLWRIIVTAIIVFTSSSTYYLLITTALIVQLLLCAVVAPRLHGFDNRFDTFIVATLLALNIQDWFMFTNTVSYHHNHSVAVTISAVVKMFLLYLPILLLAYRYIRKQCLKYEFSRLCNDIMNCIQLCCHEKCTNKAKGGELNLSSNQHIYGEECELNSEYTC